MKSGSWASYLAACPELYGEPDDDRPRRLAPPNCGSCGRFVDCKPGSGARFDIMSKSIFGDGYAEWFCRQCAAKIPLPPTPEELKASEAKLIAGQEAAYRAAWEEEMAELAADVDREVADASRRCEGCGRLLMSGVCDACDYPDTPDFESDDVPW